MKTNTQKPNTKQIGAIIFLLITNVGTIFFYILGPSSEEVFKNQFPYIHPARSFINQNNFIVNLQPIRERLNELSRAFEARGGKVSIYVEFLNTGGNISINQNTYIYPASLTKLPISLVVMKKVENGDWELSNELVLTAADRNSESGNLEHMLAEYPVGTRFTIEKLLEELLIHSDNTAALILLRNINKDELQNIIDEIGLENLFTEEGRYSGKEYARLFRSLYTSSFLTPSNSQYILELLSRSDFKEFLAKPLPEEIVFSHKYGMGSHIEGTDFYSDSGIVYIPDRPYLITVMVEGERTKEFRDRTLAFMQDVSSTTYTYFINYEK